MQLSYKVIKNNSIKNNGLKEIITDANQVPIKSSQDITIINNMDSYDNLAKTILENARKQKDLVLARAYEEARKIQDEALISAEKITKEAYDIGFKEGKELGFNTAYSEAKQNAEKEKNLIIASAEELLMNAKIEYENYFENKKSEIFNLVVCAAEAVLKKELNDKTSINNMIYAALEASKNTNNFIIKCNELYIDELKVQVAEWKGKLGFMGDIFILKDNNLELGNAIIDKGNGKIVISIDCALLKIKELLEGKE